MGKRKRSLPLSVVVLRGLWAAIDRFEMEMQCSDVGEFSRTDELEFQRARLWLHEQSLRRGWHRVFPAPVESKRQRERDADVKRERVRVRKELR
jgi:hypothetical protein